MGDENRFRHHQQYVFLVGAVLKRSWVGEANNVFSVLVVIGVNDKGYRKTLTHPNSLRVLSVSKERSVRAVTK